jgi:hypothetical protein
MAAELTQSLVWLSEAERSLPESTARKVGMEDYRFYAGRQDSQDVIEKLAEQKRPATVYNEVKPKIDMLIGLAAQSKHEPVLLPVGGEDEAFVQLMQSAMKYYRKQTKLTRKELECFAHTVKCGRSLLHFWVDIANPYDPKIKAVRIPTYNFYIDSNSKEYDLSDARFLFMDKWLEANEIAFRFGTDEEEVKQMAMYSGSFGNSYGSTTNFTDMPVFFNEGRRKYRLVENWYYMYEKFIYVLNPVSGKPERMCVDMFGKFKEAMLSGIDTPKGRVKISTVDELQPVDSFDKQYYYRIFSGEKEYAGGKSPYKYQGYPCAFYGAYNDEDENTWFSAVKMQKDPQKALNTMRRQLQHLLQTLPKGILAHEAGAIINIEEYEQRSAEPNFHLELTGGGLDKFKFIQQPQISPIYQTIDVTMSQSMKDASGIQNEMMGVQTTSREPGVTVRQRQETGLAVLYSLYDNFKESRLQGDKILLGLVQQYVTTEKVMRIEGTDGINLISVNTQTNPQLAGFNDISAGEFDVEISEQIESPTQRATTAQILTEFSQNNPGAIPPEVILDYLDAPYTVKQQIKEYRAQQQEAAEKQAETELQLKLLELEIKANGVEYKKEIEEIKARSMSKTKQTGGANGNSGKQKK